MKLIKKINNNFALALEKNGDVVVVSGRGIGFGTVPRNLRDESEIDKIYWGVNRKYIEQMGEIPEVILNISDNIVSYAKKNLHRKFSKNFMFTLADHIEFTLERYKQNMIFDFKGYYDFMQLYPGEVEVARYAMKQIEIEMKVCLPDSELGGFVMNIVNSQLKLSENEEGLNYTPLILQITKIIEKHFSFILDKESYNYSRFNTHMIYLLHRLKAGKSVTDDNRRIYEKLLDEYPKTQRCVNDIAEYLNESINYSLDENEKLYLILHVNRLCS